MASAKMTGRDVMNKLDAFIPRETRAMRLNCDLKSAALLTLEVIATGDIVDEIVRQIQAGEIETQIEFFDPRSSKRYRCVEVTNG